ncbi:MAG: energy transducer TonB [Candidatus Nitrohelix vancouverensis]|uniref:Energy transducer TonB n=1 Tax=Candidatus Nitrohelix vancouverensis TaxID=2705534 RepID=A0A7T0G4U0_9BACT|nr:MAG: energy transducer TonB [Candidatus Nitrohelix vancouverensis]
MSLLDGFDPEPYAASETEATLEDLDDGESISLDTKEVKYASYFARIKHQIERVWAYPIEAAQRGIQGAVVLRFVIDKHGTLAGVWVKETSDSNMLDLAAIKAVKDAAPFYPFPITISKEKISIAARFEYTPRFVHADR